MIFVLVLVAWFYGSTEADPESVTRVYATAQECVSAGHTFVATAEKSGKVKGAQFECIAAKPVDKT